MNDMHLLYADAEPDTKRRLARALFDAVEVLGPRIWLVPSAEAMANGWAITMEGDFQYTMESRYGRGERARPSANRQIRGCRVSFVMPRRLSVAEEHRTA